jgi:hypothetical protein
MTDERIRHYALLAEIALCMVLGLAGAWAIITTGPSLGLALLVVLVTGRLLALAHLLAR